jgi:hypothetical protein
VLHLEDDLPQFSQVDNLRIRGIGLGLARHHRGRRQESDYIEGLGHPTILRRASRYRRRGRTVRGII